MKVAGFIGGLGVFSWRPCALEGILKPNPLTMAEGPDKRLTAFHITERYNVRGIALILLR
jgi:hypothetical protein